MADEDLNTRLSILEHLKENGGKITYDDLVDLGVYEPGTLAEGGIIRFFQNLDTGGPAHLAGILEREYALSNFDTSFAQLDQELRSQRGAELTMLFAMAAAPLIDTAIYGRALSPNDMYNPNSRMDNIEQEGWSIKGPQSYIESPKVAEDSGGSDAGVGEVAKVGDDFGKLGIMVENPTQKADWANTSVHGTERMVQRGVTQDMVNTWLENGKVLEQNSGNYIYITKEGAAVFNRSGKLITTYTSAEYDDAMWAVVKKLFGE